jgi:hypothetical protein
VYRRVDLNDVPMGRMVGLDAAQMAKLDALVAVEAREIAR